MTTQDYIDVVNDLNERIYDRLGSSPNVSFSFETTGYYNCIRFEYDVLWDDQNHQYFDTQEELKIYCFNQLSERSSIILKIVNK
jgi:hypothetical protein